ncbi:hypothetical protein KUTeg_019820 [Tegillarca granosa]|uniref:Transglutaminase N-terminal domain-containing protein n=1 Tax=Tegillarca granosa TaxID=220873 RepID=A0ABQ9EDK3_TEGGR|nr:hypothetical protein KUTeg_019820 [Tegillarca granosa]
MFHSFSRIYNEKRLSTSTDKEVTMGGVVSRILGGEKDTSYRGTHPGLSNSNVFSWFNNWWSSEGSDVRDPAEDEKKENEERPGTPRTPANSEILKPENGSDNKPEPEPEPPILKIKNVDFNVNFNTEPHHTSEYEITRPSEGKTAQLIVRRGQIFDITITFNRPYNHEKDKNPLQHKATHVEVALSRKDVSDRHWGATIQSEEENKITVRVITPPTLYVGKWTFGVDVIIKYLDKNIVYRYKHPEPIYILFNPWCKEDAVYHHDDELLNEYILNQSGIIFQGYHRYPSRKKWDFAQFLSPVLECTLFLLEKSNMSATSRGDPVSVCRRLSALANGPDDDGILVGNWSGNYSGGTSPLSWTGSLAIIEEYMKNNEPVKFGQCWVFSAILTTSREAHYHASCRKNHTRTKSRPPPVSNEKKTQEKAAHKTAFEFLCTYINELENIINGSNVERMSMLRERCLQYMIDKSPQFYSSFYRTEKLKAKLIKHFGSQIKFWRPNYKSELVFAAEVGTGEAVENAFEIASSDSKRLDS